jgi:Flp pilus assembly protein TadB
MPQDQPAASGTTILVTMAIATAVLTGLIAGFCVLEAWWLLPLIMVALLASACGVVAYFFHVMRDDEAELAGH